MFWYFGWHKRIFKAKCLIPLFRYHHLQVLYFCRNGEPVSKKEKKKCTSQASQPRVSKREKKKCRSQASQLPVSNFEPDLHFWRRALRAKHFQIWTENVDAGSSILILREHLSHSSSPLTTLYLRLQEFSPLQDQVVSQEGCSFGHQHGSESVVLKPQPLWAPAQRQHAQ